MKPVLKIIWRATIQHGSTYSIALYSTVQQFDRHVFRMPECTEKADCEHCTAPHGHLPSSYCHVPQSSRWKTRLPRRVRLGRVLLRALQGLRPTILRLRRRTRYQTGCGSCEHAWMPTGLTNWPMTKRLSIWLRQKRSSTRSYCTALQYCALQQSLCALCSVHVHTEFRSLLYSTIPCCSFACASCFCSPCRLCCFLLVHKLSGRIRAQYSIMRQISNAVLHT